MAVVAGSAARSDLPVIRGYGPWAYDFSIERGAWGEWLAALAADEWPGVMLGVDHQMGTLDCMAATRNGTLTFDLVDVGGYEYLTFTADFLEDDDPDRTLPMTIMLAHLRSGRVDQVSVGAILTEYRWEFADDDDNDHERDQLIASKTAMYELSFVPFGAQGDDARAAVVTQALGAARVDGDDYAARLGAGPMRLSTLNAQGDAVPFEEHARASRDAAHAEWMAAKMEAEKETDRTESLKGAAQKARDRIRGR